MARFASLACLICLTTLGATPALAQRADDPLSGLSTQVAGLLDIDTPAARLMLAEEDHGVRNSWFVGIGEEYADGWRLASVSQNAFVMQRGDETRQVPVSMVARGGSQPMLALNTPPALPLSRPAGPGLTTNTAPQPAPGRGGRGAGGRNAAVTPGNAGLFQGGRGLIAPQPQPPPARPSVVTADAFIVAAPEGLSTAAPPLPPNLPPNATVVQEIIQTPEGPRTVVRVSVPPPQ